MPSAKLVNSYTHPSAMGEWSLANLNNSINNPYSTSVYTELKVNLLNQLLY